MYDIIVRSAVYTTSKDEDRGWVGESNKSRRQERERLLGVSYSSTSKLLCFSIFFRRSSQMPPHRQARPRMPVSKMTLTRGAIITENLFEEVRRAPCRNQHTDRSQRVVWGASQPRCIHNVLYPSLHHIPVSLFDSLLYYLQRNSIERERVSRARVVLF